MEKPIRGPGDDEHREEPAAQNRDSSLRQNCQALEKKVTGRQSKTRGSGQRNHQLVDQSGEGERRKRSHDDARSTGHWSENQTEREIVERAIPTAAPELRDGSGAQRRVHDRPSIDSQRAPTDAQEREQAEVKN